MSDPNPYESPREAELLTTPKPLEQGPSVAFIIVLTPFASILAGVLGVWTGMMIILAAGGAPGWHEGLLMLVFLGAAVSACAGMLTWAGRAAAKRRNL